MKQRWVRGHDLRVLREQADVSCGVVVAAGCAEGCLRDIETSGDQPSGRLTFRLACVLGRHLRRKVGIDELSHPWPTRSAPSAGGGSDDRSRRRRH